MEFPHLGRNCAYRTCNKLDFLPYKCGGCLESFCSDHFAYANHDCPAPNNRDVQVPECPLCGAPVPGRRGERPDVAVGEHIDNQCMSDPAKERRKKVYTNRCAYKGCKTKEMIPVVCGECSLNYCLKHRHTADHACEGKLAAKRRKAAEAAMARIASSRVTQSTPGVQTGVANFADVQGNMSEDEALARALSLSLQNASLANGDIAVARALARRVGADSQVSRPYRPEHQYTSVENFNRGGYGFRTNFQNFIEIMKILAAVFITLYVFASLKYMIK